MSTNLRTQSPVGAPPNDGGVWYELRSEREEICEALQEQPEQTMIVEMNLSKSALNANQLQERLRLIDDALDRLMTGLYGDCIVCGRWIEDTRLHADPALPFCIACQGKAEREGSLRSPVFHPGIH